MSADLYAAGVGKVAGLYEEYLRRNLLVASAIGASAAARCARERATSLKRQPKWLIAYLDSILERVDRLPPDLARWRDTAHDRPHYVSGPIIPVDHSISDRGSEATKCASSNGSDHD